MTLEKHERIDNVDHIYDNLQKAKEACENLKALCGGLVEEVGGREYTLRKKGPPKHSDQELTRLLLSKDDVHLHGALGNDLRQAWVKLRQKAATGDFKLNREGKKDLNTDTRVVIDVSSDQLSSNQQFRQLTLKEVLARNTTTYVKYCPGFYGSYQKVPVVIQQNIGQDVSKWLNEEEGRVFRHFFAYKLTVEV